MSVYLIKLAVVHDVIMGDCMKTKAHGVQVSSFSLTPAYDASLKLLIARYCKKH